MQPKLMRFAMLLFMGLSLGAAPAAAMSINVTFDADPLGLVPGGNNFTSIDPATAGIHFIDTVGTNLVITNNATLTNGTNALSAGSDGDGSALRIELDFVAQAIQMDIGNDPLALTAAGDGALLSAFLNGMPVGVATFLPFNRDSAMNQTIAFAGASFNAVVLQYQATNAAGGLTEVVDNVHVTSVIPEPRAGVAFAAGVLLIGAVCRKTGRVRGQRRSRQC